MRVAGAHAHSRRWKSLALVSYSFDSPDNNICTCTLYLHMTLQCDRENYEHLKYLKNGYCVRTNHSKDQDTRTGHKTTN